MDLLWWNNLFRMARVFVISVVVFPNTVGCLYIAVLYVTRFGKSKPMTKVESISDFELKIDSVYNCIFVKTNHVIAALHYMFIKGKKVTSVTCDILNGFPRKIYNSAFVQLHTLIEYVDSRVAWIHWYKMKYFCDIKLLLKYTKRYDSAIIPDVPICGIHGYGFLENVSWLFVASKNVLHFEKLKHGPGNWYLNLQVS